MTSPRRSPASSGDSSFDWRLASSPNSSSSFIEQLLLSRGLVAAGVHDSLGLLDEVANLLKLLVNTGEAEIRNLVELAQPRRNQRANNAALDLAVVAAEDFVLDLVDQPLDRVGGNRPLPAGPLHAGRDLGAVV